MHLLQRLLDASIDQRLTKKSENARHVGWTGIQHIKPVLVVYVNYLILFTCCIAVVRLIVLT